MLGTCMGYERDMSGQHIPLVKPSTHRRFKRFTGYVVEKRLTPPFGGVGGGSFFHLASAIRCGFFVGFSLQFHLFFVTLWHY